MAAKDRDDRPVAEQVRTLPTRAGVYLLRDRDREVLYVGKATSLRSRVRSYLRPDASSSVKLRELARRIHSVETFVVESETEALLLEWNLIKEHRPPFNIQLRDDKSYPYIKVTVGEPFPRIFVTRRLEEDGSRYFGPFTDVGAMRRALRAVKKMYTVRSCHYDMPREMPDRPCLDYHIGRCRAPCAGHQSREEYRAMIDEILEILAGRTGAVKKVVRKRMRAAAEDLDFERAAEQRDVLRGLRAMESRQTAVDFRGGDRDVVGIHRKEDAACGVVLKVREGKLMGRRVHYLRNVETEDEGEVVGAFVKGFYLRQEDLPPELVVPAEFADRALVEEYLSARRDGRFRVQVPRRGRKRRLVELAEENAAHVHTQDRLRAGAPEDDGAGTAGDAELRSETPVPAPARRLMEVLELRTPVRSLVCFDVSTLGGSESVGSAVWMKDGRPVKDEYRRFRIRAADRGRPDDYAMMQEIVGRYFGRRVGEGKRLPELVVIDGGKGQLGAASQAMESAGVSDLPVVALAKREEEVFRPGAPAPLRLERTDPALHWLQRARDEAHRFALRYNRTLRRRRTLRSRLTRVPGVGTAREQELLRRFGSLEAIRSATAEELEEVPGIGRKTASRILESLRADEGSGAEAPEEREAEAAKRAGGATA